MPYCLILQRTRPLPPPEDDTSLQGGYRLPSSAPPSLVDLVLDETVLTRLELRVLRVVSVDHLLVLGPLLLAVAGRFTVRGRVLQNLRDVLLQGDKSRVNVDPRGVAKETQGRGQ